MRITYIVLAHARPAQLARLVDRLGAGGDRVLVHVDAKQDLAPFTAALSGTRAELLPRVRCDWGGWGLVEATLAGMSIALGAPTDHLVLLSGQDYPVRPRAEVVAALEGGRVHLRHRPLPAPDWVDGGGMDRLERWYLRPSRKWSVPNHVVPWIPKRRLPAGLAPHAGGQFWTLPADVARDLLDELAARPEVVRFFRRSFVPDESFFQMLVLNGPHAGRVVNDDRRFIRHPAGEAHPRLLEAADLPAIRASAALWARKFDAERDPGLLDEIDRELLRRVD